MRFEWRITKDNSATVFDHTVAESYKSSHAARTESEAIFLTPGLKEHPKWQSASERSDLSPIRILEYGFGLGTNFLVLTKFLNTLAGQHPRLEFHSCDPDLSGLEFYLGHVQSETGADAIEIEQLSQMCRQRQWQGDRYSAFLHPCKLEDFLQSESLPVATERKFDVIFFDPFSPAAAPRCWDATVFRKIGQFSAPEARLVTYSVARAAKDGTTAAGFTWQKRTLPAILHKRSSLLAVQNRIECPQ